MQAPEAVRAIRAHGVTTTFQEHLDAPIAIPRVLSGKLMHDRHGWRITCHQPGL